MNVAIKIERWPIGSAEGRWKGFGPYYAMFPVSFAEKYIEEYSQPGDTIIDPFCGRGTSNYIANLLRRHSIGCDVNAVAWVYSKAKTDPERQINRLLDRIDEIWDLQKNTDRIPINEFQRFAWAPNVLAFLNSARRELNWRRSKVDWTVAGIILVYLHGKLGGGLSNQMRQSKSMAPEYAVRWWKKRDMDPPVLDPVEFIRNRILWRYEKGVYAKDVKSQIFLGDARDKLRRLKNIRASLLLTSPPYMGVTNYEYDNWVRLWLLGGPAMPSGKQTQRYANRARYEKMLFEVFAKAKKIMSDDACLVVRTDRRRYTLETTAYTLQKLWPQHRLFGRQDIADGPTQTALFGDKSSKPGEVDLLVLPRWRGIPDDFFDIATLFHFLGESKWKPVLPATPVSQWCMEGISCLACGAPPCAQAGRDATGEEGVVDHDLAVADIDFQNVGVG